MTYAITSPAAGSPQGNSTRGRGTIYACFGRLAFWAFCLVTAPTMAARIAIIDSGVDYKHKDLVKNIWTNSSNPVQTKDADGNVYEDDLHGWNFAENNNEVIDYKYLGKFSPDCTKFFEVQGKILRKTATDEDKAWYKSKRDDEAFIKELSTFGNFVHGTHVAGISSHDAAKSQLIAVKLIPTEPPGAHALLQRLGARHFADSPGNPLAQMMLMFLAQQQGRMLAPVGKFTKAVEAEVANGSFGASVKSAKAVVAGLLKTFLGHEPTDEEATQYATFFIQQVIESSKEFVQAAPDTLFVFAAGNDGTDNDSQPVSPANIKENNTISVAATLGVTSLASFSNFGSQMVDVAAPGVTIRSTIPGDQYLEMSGTSMAAPFVTNVAGVVKDQNPKLTPANIREILMGTVDVKSFLAGKVKSSGIVNRERAEKAAELSVTKDLASAIAQAKTEVPDVKESWSQLPSERDIFVLPLPSIW